VELTKSTCPVWRLTGILHEFNCDTMCKVALVLISAFGYQRHKSTAQAVAAPATD
jgi:hypothetical protein